MSEAEELAYQDGIRKALLWVFSPPQAQELDFRDCSDVWQKMGQGLDGEAMQKAVSEIQGTEKGGAG